MSDQQQKSSGLKWLFIGCGACGCLAAIAFGIIMAMGGLAIFGVYTVMVETVRGHVQMVQGGDLDGAYAATSPTFQQNTTLEQFKAFVQQNPQVYGPGLTFEMSGEGFNMQAQNNKAVAVVHGEMKPASGSGTKVTFHLEQVGDAWKVMGVEPQGGGQAPQAPAQPQAPAEETTEVESQGGGGE